ncbi:MAG: type II secretion system protein [Gammaproteobacteria bacterium]
MKKEAGFSLIELLFVLAIAAMIILFAANRYQQFRFDQNLAVTQRSVQTLLHALNHYFYQHCREDTYKNNFQDDKVATLLTQYNKDLIANPFGFPFEVKIIELTLSGQGKPRYQLELSADYPSMDIAAMLKQLLGAEFADIGIPRQRLVWRRLPTLSKADSSAAYWIQTEAFNQEAHETLRRRGGFSLGVCDNTR